VTGTDNSGCENTVSITVGINFGNDVILSNVQQLNQYFDASMVWGHISGRMFYGGLRFKIQ
jgi:hypothetical protein